MNSREMFNCIMLAKNVVYFVEKAYAERDIDLFRQNIKEALFYLRHLEEKLEKIINMPEEELLGSGGKIEK